ncbi:MAG: universal stress protein [Caulobacteraceae bacterium]
MYRKVLLAYDGTMQGAVALREGALLAKRCGAAVFILSVAPEVGGMQFAEGVQNGPVALQMERYRELLDRGVDRLKRLGMEPVSRLAAGDPAKVIGAFAREVGADLVVVGHHRRNMLERWWSGPSGAYLSDHIGCSLLIARSVVSDEVFEDELRRTEEARLRSERSHT